MVSILTLYYTNLSSRLRITTFNIYHSLQVPICLLNDDEFYMLGVKFAKKHILEYI